MKRSVRTITFLSFLIIVFSPFTAFSLYIGTIPFYLVEILILGLIGWLLVNPLTVQPMRKTATLLFGQAFILTGVILGLFLISDTTHGWGILKSWFLFPILLCWILKKYVRTSKERDSVILGWLFALACVSLFGLGSWIIGDLTYDGRLRSFFLSPNYLAMFLFPAPLLTRYAFQKKLLPNWLSLGIGFQTVAVIYLTFSYTVWISLFVSFIVWLLWDSTLTKYSVRTVCGVFLLILLLGGTQWNNPKIEHWFTSPERSSLASRVTIWHAAEKMLNDHPVLGIGAGNFQTTYLDYQRYFPPYLEWAVPEPHNLFLAFWLESGLIGLIGFLIVSISSVRSLFQLRERNGADSLPTLLLVLLIAFFIQGLFDTPYWKIDLAYLFWCIIGLV